MKLINRSSYMDTLTSLIGVPDIKVITGIRRSGKSKLLEALRDYVEANLSNSNVIHINYNLDEFENLLEYHALLAYVKEHRVSGKQNFLLIDEVQMCDGFERAINSLHASEQYDIFITGSNAFLLSSDLSTLFTGRTFEIEVFPFSFEEYRFYGDEGEVDRDFDEYARTGGMSGSYPYPLQEQRYQYLSNVFKTLIVRDIVQRHNVRNESALLRIADYMMDNVSNITSARNITDALNADGLKITNKTVGTYMGYLCDAFAFYKVRRYDIRGKKYLKSGEKYYLADHAFKYALLGTRDMDWGRVYENMVAIELLRRGYEVYVGVLYKKEIDFVAIKRSEKLYIQVSDDISSDKTFEREISPLLSIGDAYPKMILARTRRSADRGPGEVVVRRGVAESLFLKTEKFSFLRNRLGERLRGLWHRACSTYAPVLPQLLHAAVDFADTLDGELSVDHVEGIGRIGDDAGETACGDNGDILAAQLALHARDQALCHGGSAHLLGIAADGVLGRLERNAGELGGSGGECVHRNADARRDRPTNVITVLVDDVDIGRGAKVHHDRRRAVESLGCDGVGDAVGAHGLGARRTQLGHRGRLRSDDDGVRRDAVGHGVPLARELWHHAGKGDRIDRAEREVVHLKEAHQAHVDFVGGIGAVGGHAPRLHQLVSVKQAHGRLRVTHIDSEQHVYSRCRCKRTRTIVYVPSTALGCDSFTAIGAEGVKYEGIMLYEIFLAVYRTPA